MHGRLVHLATKVLIRERAVLHGRPEEDVAQLPAVAQPLVPHRAAMALWEKVRSIPNVILRRCLSL